MSVPPGWILKALAGNARSVAWAKQTCSYKVESVTTGLYPIEPIEAMAATGSITAGRMQEIIKDHYETTILFKPSTIIQTRAFVYASQPPDHYETTILFRRGDIFETRTFVNASQPPDHYETTILFKSGYITAGVLTAMPHDAITATATVLDGSLE